MKRYKVNHFEIPGFAGRGLKVGDILPINSFTFAGEAESLVKRGFLLELTPEEIAAIPETEEQPIASEAIIPVVEVPPVAVVPEVRVYTVTAEDIARNKDLAEKDGLVEGDVIELPYEGFEEAPLKVIAPKVAKAKKPKEEVKK